MSRPFTEQLTEGQAFAGGNVTNTLIINNAATVTTAINMAGMRRARAFLHVGAVTSTGNVNFTLQSSATSGGTFNNINTATTSPAINAITTSNTWYSIEIRADQMPAGQPWLRASALEVASQNVVADVFIVADCSAYDPGNQYDTVTWTTKVVTAP